VARAADAARPEGTAKVLNGVRRQFDRNHLLGVRDLARSGSSTCRSDKDRQTCFIAVDHNNPQTQKHILGSQYTSDGGGRPHTADRHETSTNLLGYWARERQAMLLEEAVYRLTGKTALMHDMHDRGFITAGKVPNITIFDPDRIAPKPREPAATLPGGGVQVSGKRSASTM
jgi:N-acyl-D-aspartate/D-glutamate deacylase